VVSGSAILDGGKTVTAKLEMVVDQAMSGEELLSPPN
jgi:hypothetical protein